MDSKPIVLDLWVLCPTKFCGFCILELHLYEFHAYHTWCFVGSVSVTHSCMGLMPITLVSLWVLCFGVIIFWDLNILWVLCHCLYFVISDHVHLSGVSSHTFACGLAVFFLVSSGMLALLVTHISHMISWYNLWFFLCTHNLKIVNVVFTQNTGHKQDV